MSREYKKRKRAESEEADPAADRRGGGRASRAGGSGSDDVQRGRRTRPASSGRPSIATSPTRTRCSRRAPRTGTPATRPPTRPRGRRSRIRTSGCAPALSEIYGWYERVEPMLEKLYRDISVVPALAHQMEQGAIPYLNHVAELLAVGRPRRKRTRAAIGHALAFDTWRSLVRAQGVSDKQAVDLMAALVAAPRPGYAWRAPKRERESRERHGIDTARLPDRRVSSRLDARLAPKCRSWCPAPGQNLLSSGVGPKAVGPPSWTKSVSSQPRRRPAGGCRRPPRSSRRGSGARRRTGRCRSRSPATSSRW